MGESAIALGYFDLVLATALVLLAGVASLVLRLNLEGQLAVGASRTVIQLLLVGVLLKWVFDLAHPLPVIAVMLVMIAVAAVASVRRSSRSFAGAYLGAFLTLLLAGILTTFAVTGFIIRVDPWYRPQYVIPLFGMILGNALTGISLCLDSFLETLSERRDRIETELALGATRWEAARDPLSDAVRRGMIPIINAMMVVGIVSLPGMMTGQILQGADPLEAVKYQIVVMFMVAAGTAAGCILMAMWIYRRLFNDRHQLCTEGIRRH